MTRITRKPDGLPRWPLTLLAGTEKVGKTWAAAAATASQLIGKTYWITVKEPDPDEYSQIPGTDWEYVQIDGTVRDIHAAVQWAAEQPTVDNKPNLIVLDSATELWEMISRLAQKEANERAAKKGRGADVRGEIHPDIWNRAGGLFTDIIKVLKHHQGPSIVIAREEKQTLFEDGKPTKDKAYKILAQKSLPGIADVIIEMPERGQAYLTGIRSYKIQLDGPRLLPNFTMDALWHEMGLDQTRIGTRSHGEKPNLSLLKDIGAAADEAGIPRPEIDKAWREAHNGQSIAEATDLTALAAVLDELRKRPTLTQVAA